MLAPHMYSVEGTREPSRGFLRAVIAGDPQRVKNTLAILHPSHRIGWHWEPYSVLERKSQQEALRLLLDHPQFRFDAEFVAACCYFTNKSLRTLVCQHPRARRWVENPSAMWKDAELCYCSSGRTLNVGLKQRPYYAVMELGIHHNRLQARRRWALTFLLVPALRFWIQRRIEELYAPGGHFALKGAAAFATAVAACANTKLGLEVPPAASTPHPFQQYEHSGEQSVSEPGAYDAGGCA